ncbi:MAG TPA: VCBS repeat-containing protein [Kiritimatiellia bacterium]|nr:VCBS repeat-containing protein [Kiritimatiellia bacterium]HMP00540.1 VCBS repeat-containing protein [Kiritimatiellia bacterium]
MKRICCLGLFVMFGGFAFPAAATTPVLGWESPIKGASARQAALGDVNGDGFPDAAWVQLQDPGLILLNDGGGNFTPHPAASPLPPAAAIAMGDLNGNGHLDLLIGLNLGQCQIWTNQGDGTFFFTGQSIGPSVSRRSVALADVNGNGHLDAILPSDDVTKPSEVWTNNSMGGFSFAQTVGSNWNRQVAVGDINGNGFSDLVFAANGDNTVWTNNGSGMFSRTGGSAGAGSSFAIALGDLNGNGHLDAFVANQPAAPANQVWFNNGSGFFTNSGQSLGSNSSFCVVLIDVDANGSLDAIVGNTAGQTNVIWLNDGAGLFTPGPVSLGVANAFDIKVADVDGDGDADYFLTVNANPSEVWLRVPVAQGGPLKDSGQRIGGHQMLAVDAGDFNGTGFLDIAFGASGGMAGIKTNDGSGRFYPRPQKLVHQANIGAIRSADVNSNGWTDLVVGLDQSSGSNIQTRIWHNNGSGVFVPGPTLSVARATVALAVADLTGNGLPDIVEGNRPTAPLPSLNPTNVIHFNAGGGNWMSVDALGGGHSSALGIGDVNADGWPDIVVGNKDIPSTVWFSQGGTQFVASGQSLITNVQDVVLADVNGNGHLDLFLVASPRSLLYTNNGAGQFFVLSSNFFTSAFFMKGAALDWNDDGFQDLWIGQGSVGPALDRFYLNEGGTNFGFAVSVSNANINAGLVSGDFTGNGRIDLFSAGGRGDSQLWVKELSPGAVELYAASFGLSGGDILPFADPDGDGIPNILEYAYNLNPAVADAQIITDLATATNGLPFINVVLSNGAPWFVAETIRLVNPVEISYHLDVAQTLVFTGSVNASVSTSPLNADYERAVYQAPAPASAMGAFGRFRVEPEP